MTTSLRRRRVRRAVIAALLGFLAPAAAAQPAEAPPPTPAATTPAKAPKGKAKGGKAAKPGKVDVAVARTALLGADAAAAGRAADELATVKEPAAHDALLDGLSAGLTADVAARAIAGLATLPAPADLAVLRFYATHRTPAVRAAADTALAGFPDGRKHLIKALGDRQPAVRLAAAEALAKAKARDAVDRLFALLARGDESAVKALGLMADPEMARAIGEQLGKVPDAALARCLGILVKRPDFGPDEARVEVVKTLAKIAGSDALNSLTDYVEATPAKPVRESRKLAEKVIAARIGGDK
jgi:HEAT repeat protein